MRKFFLFSLLAICSVVAKAQDSYADAVKAFGLNNIQNTGVDMNAIPADMVDDMFECMVEAFRESGVTIDDMKEVSAFYATPEGQEINRKAKLMQGPEAQEKLQKVLMPSLMPLMMGGQPKPIQMPDVSASYKKKFHKYCEATNATSMMTNVFSSLESAMGNDPEAEKVFAPIKKFMSEQGENYLLAVCYDIYTENDLDAMNEAFKKPGMKHVMTATNAFVPKFMQRVLQKYGK